MHELGIITNVVESAKSVAMQNYAMSIDVINLKIGVMREVIDDALNFSFDILKEDEPLLKKCKLNVDYVSPKYFCPQCDNIFEEDRFHRTCPKCNNPLTELIEGDELEIDSIEIGKSD